MDRVDITTQINYLRYEIEKHDKSDYDQSCLEAVLRTILKLADFCDEIMYTE